MRCNFANRSNRRILLFGINILVLHSTTGKGKRKGKSKQSIMGTSESTDKKSSSSSSSSSSSCSRISRRSESSKRWNKVADKVYISLTSLSLLPSFTVSL
eukprot:GHVT01019967.1.p4 GENE.GHVT01019967.1~~GHVT01019967.1.p4  ORF type:complete len:100 (+),score=17.67 GHVT01019967.1:531-830(+)